VALMLNMKLAILVALAVLIPVSTWFGLRHVPPLRTLPVPTAEIGSRFQPSPINFTRGEIGPAPDRHPQITNVQIVDFDNDGRMEILACDARRHCVALLQRDSEGEWQERILAENLASPAHVTVVDLNGDGDHDLLVSILGDIRPNDGVIGQVILLEQQADGFVPHLVLDDVRRVADCQAGDLDGDGDLDLVVAVFGYAHGQVLWLENRGDGRYLDRELLSAPGTIHVPLADYDGDGDLDIATVVSQDEEELWGFENLGGGQFRSRRLWFSYNYNLGSAGLIKDDLDRDGDIDLILPVGDNLEEAGSFPQAYHGCFWFENLGGWSFEPHRIAEFGGTYAAAVADLDGDADRDVVLVSMFNNWDDPRNASVIWLENDGQQQFQPWQVDSRPTHRVTVAIGDLDGDGRNDILTGGLYAFGPYDRLGGLTAWFNLPRVEVP
jgi:hypothetical protein